MLSAISLLPTASEGQVGCAANLGSTQQISSLTLPSLVDPSSVAFHPTNRELYITDHGSDSLVTVNLTSSGHETPRYLRDRARYHYMSKISAIGFDPRGQFATCQESLNDYYGQMLPNFFMGVSTQLLARGRLSLGVHTCLPPSRTRRHAAAPAAQLRLPLNAPLLCCVRSRRSTTRGCRL